MPAELRGQAFGGADIGRAAAHRPGFGDAQPLDRGEDRVVQHLGTLIGDPVGGALDDEIVGMRQRHLLERQLGQNRLAEPGPQIDEPEASHQLVDQRAGPGQEAAALVISGDPAAPDSARDAGQRGVHAPDQLFAAVGMADCCGDLADLHPDRGVAVGGG